MQQSSERAPELGWRCDVNDDKSPRQKINIPASWPPLLRGCCGAALGGCELTRARDHVLPLLMLTLLNFYLAPLVRSEAQRIIA